jgi:hypothetical protein
MARFVDVSVGITPRNVRSDGLAPCKCSIVKLGKMTRIAAGINEFGAMWNETRRNGRDRVECGVMAWTVEKS